MRSISLFFLIVLSCWNFSAAGQDTIAVPAKLAIRQISISGNKHTRSGVILREIPFSEGDSIDRARLPGLIDQARQQLTNLALFHEIKITDSIQGKEVFVTIAVRERWYIFGEPTFALADRNFNEWLSSNEKFYHLTYGVDLYHLNFRGRNERLVINLISGWRQSLGIQYKVPALNRKKTLGAQFTGQYQIGHEVPYITSEDRLQFLRVNDKYIYHHTVFDCQFSYRKRFRTSHLFGIGYEAFNIGDTISLERNPEYLNTAKTSLQTLYLSYHFIYQNLDYFFYPLKGIYFSVGIEKKGLGLVSKDVNFINGDIDIEKYTPLPGRLYLANSIKARQSPSKILPYVYSNALGYRDLVRGYEHYVINGHAYYLSNNELKTKIFDKSIRLPLLIPSQFNPIPLKIFLKTYYDLGYVINPEPGDKNRLPNRTVQGWGAGLDFVSYYDKILRIEYSFNDLGQSELFLHYIVAF